MLPPDRGSSLRRSVFFSKPRREDTQVQMQIESKHLGDALVLAPEVFEDDRGFFMEVYREDQFKELDLPHHFMQENQSGSTKGVIRGLHFQWDPPMGKLMRVTAGSAFLVAVDIRHGSPTLGEWFGTEVSSENKRQLWAPAGFARGFCVLSDFAEIQYKCTSIYNPAGEGGIAWNDTDIGVDWPETEPLLSEKDDSAQSLQEWLATDESKQFQWK